MKRGPDTRQPTHETCLRCGKPRRRPKGKWAIEAWLTDEFCTTECAKAFHHVDYGHHTAEYVNDEADHDRRLAEAAA